MSDIADKLIKTAYVVDGMLIQRDNLLQRIPTLMRDAAIDIRDIETENAKLRELAYVSLNYCANGMCSIEDCCPMNTLDGKGRCGFIRTCRELGIEEVDW